MKIHLTIYAYGGVAGACINSIIELANLISHRNMKCLIRSVREDALISRSRSRETAVAISSGADVWFQLDHDLSFDAEDVITTCELAMEHKAAVCGVYSCRSTPPRSALRPVHDEPIKKIGANELIPITFFASGFVAIPIKSIVDTVAVCETDVVPPEYRVQWVTDGPTKSFKAQYPTLWKPMTYQRSDGSYEYLSEDYSASARLRLAGVDQLAWTKPILKHWGECGYSMPTE